MTGSRRLAAASALAIFITLIGYMAYLVSDTREALRQQQKQQHELDQLVHAGCEFWIDAAGVDTSEIGSPIVHPLVDSASRAAEILECARHASQEGRR